MKKPFFSIVVINFNSPFLNRTLTSLKKQKFSNWEAIIVDNHSKDNVREIVKNMNDKRIRLFYIQNRGLMAKSRNLGVKKSRSSLICFCDSDDWWHEDKLSELYKEYKKTKPNLAYHNMVVIDSHKKKEIKKKSKYYKNNFFLNCLKYGNPISCSSLMIKKEIIKKVGYFSLDKRVDNGWIDFDLILKSLKITKKISFIDKYLAYYWVGINYSTETTFLKSMNNFNKCYITKNNFFNKRYPWWSKALEIKKNFKSKKFRIVLQLLKITRCFKINDYLKWIFYFLSCNIILSLKK